MAGVRDDIRVGLVGYGLGGAVFHAPLITTTPGLRLVAIVTANADRHAAAARDYPGATILPRVEALFDHAVAIDVVVIASPNRTHVPLALAALGADISVVVDKPLAATAQEGRRVIDAARQRKRLLTVFHNRRWDGDFLTVQRLLAEGALGEIHRFESRYERWRPEPRRAWRENAAPEEAGGLLYDLGSHLIDQALTLFGPAATVYAELDRRRPQVAVDDDTFVAIGHSSGIRSHLWMSSVAAQIGPRIRVLGSRAAYTKYGLDVQEAALKGGARPGAAWGVEPRDSWGKIGTDDDLRAVATEPGAYPVFYRRLEAAIRDGGPPPVAAEEAVAALEVIDAARESASGKCTVILPVQQR
jgi:scyllo-inositol 2-dehydrogenase (NADP+)